MKKLIAIAFIAILNLTFVKGQTTFNNVPEPGTPYFIKWKFTEFNFGEIKKDCPADSVVFTFEVVKGIAQMTGSKSNCGCTLGNWLPTIHKEGETGIVTIHYDTKRVGYFRKSFEVQFNRNEKPETLWITGTVKGE
jgi:hypothetical protein